MSDAGYVWKTMAAAALGIALFCGGYAGAPSLGFKDWNLMSNFMATPLYALPLIVALFRFGRIGITGVLMLLGGITAAHFLATTAAVTSYEMGPIEFCEFGDVAKCRANYAREKAAHDPISHASALKSGATGGALGAAFSFGFIASLAPGLRDRRRLALYAGATAVLAALGWLGFMGTLPEDSERGSFEWVWKLYLPWQFVFSLALVYAFKDHRARAA